MRFPNIGIGRELAAAIALVILGALPAAADPESAAPAQAQAASPVTESHTFGSWSVRCYRIPGSACDISQAIFVKPRNIRGLGVSIFYVPARNVFGGQFVVPLGVALAKGMTITVGGYSLPDLKYHRCEREGCFVEGILPQALIDAMTQGGNTNAAVRVASLDGRTYTFPMQLNGFADGIVLVKQLDVQKSAAAPKKP
jgi:invasion protein IalB